MIKVLFEHSIFLHQKNGGISKYIVELNDNLKKYDIESKIYSPVTINDNLKKNNNKVFFFFKLTSIPIFCRKLFFFLNDLLFIFFVKFYKPDFIHFSYYNHKLIKFIKYLKLPYIVTVYDLIHENLNNKISKTTQFKKKELISNAKHIICISNFTKKKLLENYDVDEKKISVIHLGVKKNNFSLSEKQNYILFVGDRGRYKNFKNLLFAFKDSNFLKRNYKILCFGGKQFSKEEKELFNNLQIENCIQQRFGDDLELQRYYINSKVFISVSLVEGFGLTPLEAMSFGCPVICSNIPVFREIFENSCTYVDPNNPEDIRNKIEELIKSTSMQEKLISQGNKTVEKYSWIKCASKSANLYKNLYLKK